VTTLDERLAVTTFLQRLALAVLAELVDRPDLADAKWTLSQGALEAYLPDRPWGPDPRPAAIRRLAEEFNLAVDTLPDTKPGWTRFTAHGKYRGVRLTIWAPVFGDEAVAA
jgi:hypothetical protein